jgi:arginase
MKIFLLAAPYDSGHYKTRLGAGPPLLINALGAQLQQDGHSVRKEEVFIDTAFSTEVTTGFAVSRAIAGQVSAAKEKGEFPVVLTGNCNAAAMGTLCGLQNDCGVIWFDCHGDYNTPETTIGGFLDGMAIAMITGECWTQLTASVPGFKPVPQENIILIGARDFDPIEEKRLKSSHITLIPPGMLKHNVFEDTDIAVNSIYLHIDLDVLDPSFVQVNVYSTPGGITPEILYNTIVRIKEKHTISGIGFTAYDPAMDPEGKIQKVVNEVVKIVIVS